MGKLVKYKSGYNSMSMFNKCITLFEGATQSAMIKKYSLDPATVSCGCGRSTKDDKWYGWSHRAVFGFGKGDEIFDSEYRPKGATDEDMESMNFKDYGSKTIKSDDDAKKATKAFSKYVS